MDDRDVTDEAILGDPGLTLGAESEHMRDAIAHRLFGGGAPPQRIGRYEIERAIGRGAMGSVFAARDPNLGRTVALKVLHGRGRGAERGYVGRLVREAQLLAKLSHPNVVAVFDVGEEDGVVHIAMELVRGRTLREWMQRHPPRSRADVRVILEIFQQCARGLAAAHAAGLVHRDFKPDNVLVGDDGRVRVVDFGLARGRSEPDDRTESDDSESSEPTHAAVTATGQLVGTPAYMAPEQFMGRDVGPATDQYAFCVSLHEALYGKRPFAAKTVQALAREVVDGVAEIAPAPLVPGRVRALLRRGLSRDPAQRFPGMGALAAELQRAALGWRRFAFGAIALVAAIGGASVSRLVAPGDEPCTGAPAQAEAVWNPARAESVRAAFVATDAHRADLAADRAVEALEAFSRDWQVEHREACEATRVRGEQSADVLDRRMACLDRQLRTAAALVDVWLDADTDVVEHTGSMLERVPAVARCGNIDDVLARDPLPSDPETRAEVEALQDRLDRLVALEAAGKLTESASEDEGLVEAAERTGHRPTIARAWTMRAAVAQLRRDPKAVLEAARRALTVAVAAAEDELAAKIAVQIASHHATILAQPAEGATWAALALALAERAGGLDHVRALALVTEGHAKNDLGDPREAERLVARGVSILHDLGPSSPEYGRALADLAGIHAEQGEIERGRAEMLNAIGILREALGRDHPDVAQDIMNLAAIEVWQGDVGAARDHVSEAVGILEASLGPDNLRVADALQLLAVTELRLGNSRAAATHLDRAIVIRRATLGHDHSSLLRPLENYASTLVQLGELERAVEVAEDAARVLERSIPKDSPEHPRAMVSVGYVLYSAGAPRRGLALVADGIAGLSDVAPEPRDFELLLRYGALLRSEARPGEAVETFRRALQMLENQTEVQAPDRAQVRLRLAEAMWDQDRDRAAALELAREASEILAPRDGGNAMLASEIDAWIAAHRIESP